MKFNFSKAKGLMGLLLSTLATPSVDNSNPRRKRAHCWSLNSQLL